MKTKQLIYSSSSAGFVTAVLVTGGLVTARTFLPDAVGFEGDLTVARFVGKGLITSFVVIVIVDVDVFNGALGGNVVCVAADNVCVDFDVASVDTFVGGRICDDDLNFLNRSDQQKLCDEEAGSDCE